MTAAQTFTRTVRLSRRLNIDVTVSKSRINFAWSPDVPTRQLTQQEARRYKAARDQAVAEYMRLAGISGKAATIEV